MCTRVSDNYVSIMYICGTSVSNRLLEDQAVSLTRGRTSRSHQTSNSNKDPPAREAERVLRWVEWNLTTFTSTVPMVEIENLPLSM
jgi:hypothetical protein